MEEFTGVHENVASLGDVENLALKIFQERCFAAEGRFWPMGNERPSILAYVFDLSA